MSTQDRADTFDAAWLAARRRADDRARDEGGLARRLRAHLGDAAGAPLRVLDLGGGTGANLRHLAPRLAGPQRWHVVDRDPALLAALEAAPGVAATTAVVDLASPGGLAALAPWADADLVTHSALLDLAALDVVQALVGALRPRAWLAALEVDGAVDVAPGRADDDAILDAFRRDQRRPKGLGLDPGAAALGPDAAGALARALADAGYAVVEVETPWRLSARDDGDRGLLAPWIDGTAAAAARARPDLAAPGRRWARARHRDLAAGDLRVRVGHRDVLGVRA